MAASRLFRIKESGTEGRHWLICKPGLASAIIFRLATAIIFRLATAIIFRLATAIIFRLATAIMFRLASAIIWYIDTFSVYAQKNL